MVPDIFNIFCDLLTSNFSCGIKLLKKEVTMKRVLSAFLLIITTFTFVYSQTQIPVEKFASMQKFPGYFNFYWDVEAGKIWLEIDKFDSEFLYVNSLPAGVGSNDIGLDRNQLGRTRIVKFQRIGPKVLLIQPNYSFRAISDNTDERIAVGDGFAQSVIWGFQVGAEEKGRVKVDATSFFLRDAHSVIERLKGANQGSYRLDVSRSAIYLPSTKNFPYNTEIESILTFTGDNPGRFVMQVVPDPGSITVRQRHSFIQLPDSGYKPRIYDPRSNVGGMQFMDFSTPIDSPIVKRFAVRHRLQKKNPEAEMSDPVEPIVYYVDRGVPEPVRTALVEGASWWNEAFEAIGYKNAFQAKVLPEGADPMDIRYNMINWIHRATRGWSYGASVTDPRTGEIIKGHVALGSQRLRQDFMIAQGLIAEYEEGKKVSPEMKEMALARVRQLSCHEVGHTIGLGHNYASSVNDRASVMDYPHPLIKIKGDGTLDLSDAYDTGVGEWDKVSIDFGYQHFPDGVDEEKELMSILNKAFSRGLYFLAGQDAGPGSAHPLANVWDNGKHPVDELERMMKIRSIALSSFSEKRIPVGMPMALLEDVLVPIYLFHRYQAEAAASVLGGLYYNHTLRGDVQKHPEIVPASEQRWALEALLETIKPENLALDDHILDIIPPRPPGYRQTRELFPGYTGSTFDPLGAAETAANLTIGLILHPQRAARLVDYHSRNDDFPGLAEVLDKLFSETWKAESKSGKQAEIQRVVDYVLLYNVMKLSADKNASPQAKAIATLKLDELGDWLAQQVKSVKIKEQKAHYHYAILQIELFQRDPKSFEFKLPLAIPPGAPIGMYD